MIALLRAVAYGWRQAALAESAAEVFKLGRELHEKLGLMGNRLDKLGRALRTSVNAYNETIATVEGTVLVRARRFRELSVSERDLTALSPMDDPVRQISAAELVEDAVQIEPMVGRGHGGGRAPPCPKGRSWSDRIRICSIWSRAIRAARWTKPRRRTPPLICSLARSRSQALSSSLTRTTNVALAHSSRQGTARSADARNGPNLFARAICRRSERS